jgi:uncharacterized membrane protein
MNEDVIQIIIATYANAAAAEEGLKAVQNAQRDQGVAVLDAAVVRREQNGKLSIHETEEVTGTRGATAGGILGAVLGILAGPAGMVAGAAVGAVVGGAAASVWDTGIPHKRLAEIGRNLEPGSAALVVLTEKGFIPFLEELERGTAAQITVEAMNAQAAQRMGHDHEVALKALTMGEALADGGMASPTENREPES